MRGFQVHMLWILVTWWTPTRGIAGDDPATVVYWVPCEDIISQDRAEHWGERQKSARSDLDLETSMRQKGYFWVNGQWRKKGEPVLPARSAGELKDSDGDGFDDFTEVKFHSDPFDSSSSPEAYFRFKGSNRVIFYTTNSKAVRK